MTVVAAGLDVFAGKWVGIVLVDGAVDTGFVAATVEDALESLPTSTLAIGVDMPIGLPERDERPADLEARRLLRPHASSVFMAPPALVMQETNWEAALQLHRDLRRKGMSLQSWGLRDKILEVEALTGRAPIFEVHPEVSFWAMNGNRPLDASKHSWAGHNLRRRLLEQNGIVVPDDLPGLASAGTEDVLDAAVAAWSAHRIATRKAQALPAGSWGRGSIHY
jgi:predicted RNase H-like nuclease